jgi:hypothetical protein
MASQGEGPWPEIDTTRAGSRPRRITAEEIATGRRPSGAPALGGRQKGFRPGTYLVFCDLCQGRGHMRFGLAPFGVCPQCDGARMLEVNGERQGDSAGRIDRIWAMRNKLLWLGIGFAVACAVGLVMLFKN